MLFSGLNLLKPLLKPAAIRRLSRLWMPLGNKITIIGAGMIGCELAVFLAERGRKVTIVETGNLIAPEMPLPMKWRTEAELERLGVTVLTEVSLEEIKSNGLVVVFKNGNKKTLPSDNVIIASGAEPDLSLAEKLQGQVKEIYLAGDCSKLSFIKDAIADGTRIGSII
jgi:2,4-dienoyl-CoA reductase (NADPH2)